VKHESAYHHIKVPIGEWQLLGDGILKTHIHCCLRRLRRCARNHRWGCVDAEHVSACADLAFGNNGQRSSSAPDVEHCFARLQVRKAKQLFTESAVAPVSYEPNEQVVPGGPM
jgi:hypothetical protein